MSTYPYRIMEVVVRDTEDIAQAIPRSLHMPNIRRRQNRLILLRPQQINRMHRPIILLNQLLNMPIERRLARIRARNLDALAERLEPLLFPEDCGFTHRLRTMRILFKGERYIRGTLPRTCT